MKKGQTESYSFLIGLIIAFLILTAIGCAVYNMYKPQGMKYFDKLTNHLNNLEKKGEDIEGGELTFFVEKDKALVGFNAYEKTVEKPLWGLFSGDLCYGVKLSKYVPTIFGIEYGGLERPGECPSGKSCLCLCELSKSIKPTILGTFMLPEGVIYLNPQACKAPDVKCEVFENLELVGGKGCPLGVLIPGQKMEGSKAVERGLSVLYYSYSKQVNLVSIDDTKPLTKKELEGELEEEKKKQVEQEKQKAEKVEEYLKTKKKIYFIPVNWDKSKEEFDQAVEAHFKYTEQKLKELNERIGTTFVDSLSDTFDVISMKDYLQCKITGLNDKDKSIAKITEELTNCLMAADTSIKKESLADSKIIGLTDDEEFCAITDTVGTIISNYKDPANTAHEWGHIVTFCDEYSYAEWKDMNDDLKEEGFEGCFNPYPLCCADNPYWTKNQEEYPSYLEEVKLDYNCAPYYSGLSAEAKEIFKTKDEYIAHLKKAGLCDGHVCEPTSRKKYCRGIMGPEIACNDLKYFYEDSIEYSYLDFDRYEDYGIREELKL